MKFSIETENWYEIVIILVIISSVIVGIHYYETRVSVKSEIREDTIYYVNDDATLEKINSTSVFVKDIVSCGSDSMGLVLDCNDIIYSKLVTDKTILREGRIYSYRKNSTANVVHRLILDCNDGCFGYIFKGDNNHRADDVVDRKQIIKEVYQTRYR